MFDRYLVITLILSAILSACAFVAANDKPKMEIITFEEPIIIAANLEKDIEVIVFEEPTVITAKNINKVER